MRGIPIGGCSPGKNHGITPAHAGNTLPVHHLTEARWDHPRACGEYRRHAACRRGDVGSPPRMRGIPRHPLQSRIGFGITPAHAGNTSRSILPKPESGDHPRACGEYRSAGQPASTRRGSPPRMRGILFCQISIRIHVGITPAHAGNTAPPPHHRTQCWDHPRACGEYLTTSLKLVRNFGSPPRMRGIPVMTFGDVYVEGITPAHAGNTRLLEVRSVIKWDHPRACGEY